MVLFIGAKLQYVVATLAMEVADAPGAYVGQLLRPRDELFWLGRPALVLSILHLVLFQVRILHPNISYTNYVWRIYLNLAGISNAFGWYIQDVHSIVSLNYDNWLCLDFEPRACTNLAHDSIISWDTECVWVGDFLLAPGKLHTISIHLKHTLWKLMTCMN